MAIKFEDIKDDDAAAKKPRAAKPAAALPPAEAPEPTAPMVAGGLPFDEPANPPKPKRRGRSKASGG